MTKPVRPIGETALAFVALFLLTLTLVDPGWIERFGFEPDAGNGMAEWLVVALFALGALVIVAVAARDWRRWVVKRRSEPSRRAS